MLRRNLTPVRVGLLVLSMPPVSLRTIAARKDGHKKMRKILVLIALFGVYSAAAAGD
jgi:hypothetical protein